MRLKIVHILAVIPVVDVVIGQVQTVLHPTIGPLSFLQAARGVILLCALIYMLFNKDLLSSRLRIPFLLTLCYLAFLVSVSVKEFFVTNSLALESIVHYFKILYWLTLWLVVQLECRRTVDAKLLLHGLLIGAIIASISIWFVYLTGLGQYYTWQGETLRTEVFREIKSSSGGFLTGKFVSGNLLVGGLIALYFGQLKRSWLYIMSGVLCAASMFITYARAGQAALALVIIWLVIWLLKWRRHISGKRGWLIRFGMLLCVVAVILLSALGVSDLIHRWADITDPEQAGSGRATFWLVALKAFGEGSLWDQFLGMGYSSMLNAMDAGYVLRIHTHNDFLDMLLVGGLLGLFLLMFVWFLMVGCLKRIPAYTLEATVATGVVIVYFAQGMLTGQIFGVSVMLAYVFSLTSFEVIGKEKSNACGIVRK